MNSLIDKARNQLPRRYRQLRDIWKAEGLEGIGQRTRLAAAQWLTPQEDIMPVRNSDVLSADLSQPFRAVVQKISLEQPLLVNWVITPAGPGSGGHTTIYRFIRYLEAHGYVNRIYFYDVYRGDHRYYESFVRRSYGFNGYIGRIDDNNAMEDAHAVVATAWPTAYPVFNARCTGKRFYFVQDFEPFFHPVGSLSILAENTYRMGFHAITAGPWLTEKLRAEYAMEADYFDFGCDISSYNHQPNSHRAGVAFYARPETARRGFELGLMAIEILAARRPDIDFHFYGEKIGSLPFAYIDHGRVTTSQLNDIYNRCFAGLSLSLTNVSLVPHEMLAAGCIPVVNDAIHNRIVLDNPFVRYATLNPHALASELESLCMMKDFDSLSQAATASVHSTSWVTAFETVDAIFRRVLGVT